MSAIEVVTFGCRVNGVESEAMRHAALAAGHRDIAIVNTCAVTAEAVRQARQAIRRLAREAPRRRIVVTGCAAEIAPDAFASLEGVAALMGNGHKASPEAWAAFHAAAPRPQRLGFAAAEARSLNDSVPIEGTPGRTRGFLAVQNGCDHACTFCVIPHGRGPSRSRPMGEVVAAARHLVETGHGEVVLTGVDLTAYGADLPGSPRLGTLVRQVLKHVPDLPRLRLSSLDCIEVDAALLAAFADEERLMPHLHLSLQAGDDMILKRMKRRHGRAEAVAFCAALRRSRPDIVFGVDLIAGFPTESEAMFGRSLDLVEDCGLTHLHVFPYSRREGTPAARMPQVAGTIVRERAERLRTAGRASLRRHLDGQVGRRLSVLTERNGIGRARDFTPVRLPETAPGLLLDIVARGHDGGMLVA